MAFEELKERQSVIWGAGPFERVSDMSAEIYDAVVDALPPVAGERWLDVACGTGAIAGRAAARGADVVGIDLAPALIETAKRLAAEKGLDVDYRVGAAENLAVDDASFDTVSSTFGVIFAPDQAKAASELARVVAPGGRLGLATWVPDGGIGKMFMFSARYQPPPPPGAGAPLDWGREEHVRSLLGDAFDLRSERRLSVLSIGSEEYWQLLAGSFGPMKTLLASMDEDRCAEFHDGWVAWAESTFGVDGRLEQPRDYLLTTGTRKT